jgi:hypothetical protein
MRIESHKLLDLLGHSHFGVEAKIMDAHFVPLTLQG